MKQLNSYEIEEVSGGILFLIPFTPQIAAGVAAGVCVLGVAAVGTFVGLRAYFND